MSNSKTEIIVTIREDDSFEPAYFILLAKLAFAMHLLHRCSKSIEKIKNRSHKKTSNKGKPIKRSKLRSKNKHKLFKYNFYMFQANTLEHIFKAENFNIKFML